MKKYPSKISYGLLILVVVILVGTTIPMISPPIWSGIAINLFLIVFILHIFFSTNYIIKGNYLIVKSSFIINKKIDIHLIRLISETNSIVSSPAPSLDRLQIIYDSYKSVIISPKDKAGFVNSILRINPKVVVQFKARNKE